MRHAVVLINCDLLWLREVWPLTWVTKDWKRRCLFSASAGEWLTSVLCQDWAMKVLLLSPPLIISSGQVLSSRRLRLHVHLLCKNTSDLGQGHVWLIGWLDEGNWIWMCPSAAVKVWREYLLMKVTARNLWGSCNRLVCISVYLHVCVCPSGNMPYLWSLLVPSQVIFNCKLFHCLVHSPWIEVEFSRNKQRVVCLGFSFFC